jgi:hypothetical protein
MMFSVTRSSAATAGRLVGQPEVPPTTLVEPPI